jgi:hypothetical protein
MQLEFNSHEQQDEFVFNLFQGKENGFFLDISCGNPIIGSNTYALEKFRNWNGIGFDIYDVDSAYGWNTVRKAQFVQMDVTTNKLTEFLKTLEHPIDYISLDVDNNGASYALPTLERILNSGKRFKAMTLEHEHYQHNDSIRGPSRQLLEAAGYVRLFSDVKLLTIENIGNGSESFEDWWIDPDQFDAKILEAQDSNLYSFECVAALKKTLGNTYIGYHNCSKSFPEEYRLFWNDAEQNSMQPLLESLKNSKIRVFDCFTFYNEFEIAELRIQELWDVVDVFVIAEANTTHQNNPKPYYFNENWYRFEKYKSKIRHIMIDNMPMAQDTWVNERFQRKALERGLTDLRPNDIIIVSDCDEIARPSVIESIKEDSTVNDYDRYNLHVMMSYFKLNYIMIQPPSMHGYIMVTRGRVFTDPQQEREFTFPWVKKPDDIVHLDHAGWHFTYFGETEFAKNKIKNFAHAETNTPKILDELDVDFMIANKVGLLKFEGQERFEYVKVDDYFPTTVLRNKDKYSSMIIPNAEKTIYDIYPE